jgi:hypothetical protein
MATIATDSPRSQRANASQHRIAPAPEEPAEQPGLEAKQVLGVHPRADDGNRTRVLSLGNRAWMMFRKPARWENGQRAGESS